MAWRFPPGAIHIIMDAVVSSVVVVPRPSVAEARRALVLVVVAVRSAQQQQTSGVGARDRRAQVDVAARCEVAQPRARSAWRAVHPAPRVKHEVSA